MKKDLLNATEQIRKNRARSKDKSTNVLIGTIRIKTKSLKLVQKTKTGWKPIKQDFSHTLNIIKAFKSHKNLKTIIDTKHPEFLKGQLYKGKCQGARINLLPNNEKIDKAYSLFAKNITLHDQSTHNHWDLIYQNPNGDYTYCYTLKKKQQSSKNKYKKVNDFEKNLPKIKKSLTKAIKDKQDIYALPIQTLLNTKMRIGSEIYYKTHNHKGLSTLTKSDIKIKNNQVTFNFLGKDGVPQNITKPFSKPYINRLKQITKSLKSKDFIFTNKNNHPVKDTEIKQAFKKYCGQEFYPHIVRSHYATKQTQDFIKNNKSPTKQQVQEFYTKVAHELGHKKFNKKTQQWQESYNVTIHHYIQPELISKIEAKIKN